MLNRKAWFTGITAFFILSLTGLNSLRADVPNWFLDALFSFANTTVANHDALQSQVDAQQATIDALTAQLAGLQAVNDLAPYLEVDDTTDPLKPVVRIVGANFQIVNGLGATESINGTGNLIIGYNEAWGSTVACTDGYYNQDQTTCEDEGHVWAANHRSGSHNLVVGTGQSYSRYGGLVAGQYNVINGDYASVSGGDSHTASGLWSSVSGGYHNIASENNASVSGGADNIASAFSASISGGQENTASAGYSSVSSGQQNTASGSWSSVSGGTYNDASGNWSSVSGGATNVAAGGTSSISGGQSNATGFFYSSVSGGYNNFADASFSSISGGKDRTAIGFYDWHAGALYQDE